MSGTGLEGILESAFGLAKKMLTGKLFPQNLRAMRLLLEELLRPILPKVDSFEQLNQFLEERAKSSNTAKLWVDGFISPMLIILLYIRAEKEGEWVLHLEATKKMLPYFFAAGHHNYARYATNYLNNMYGLLEEVTKKFQKGLHVARLSDGYFNGLCYGRTC